MFGQIARFEFRYQLRNPAFWVAMLVFLLFGYGSVAWEGITLGSAGNVHKNSPYLLAFASSMLAMTYMFATIAFVANVVVRDDDSGFAPIARATAVSKFDYLIGRFTGAFGAAALGFSAVPIGIFVGSLMPWVDPETLGPNRLPVYVGAYVLFGLPVVFLTAALFFAVATATRSTVASYVVALVLFAGYIGVNNAVSRQPVGEAARAVLDPFGLSALGVTTRYWTAAERNMTLPPLDGVILWNRLLWIGVALLFVSLAYFLFRPEARSHKARKRDAARLVPATSSFVPGEAGALTDLPQPRFHFGTGGRQFLARLNFELRAAVRSPSFAVLGLVGVGLGAMSLFQASQFYGTDVWPATRVIIETLGASFTIAPYIIAIFFGGEIVWRDRDRGVHEIVGASAAPGWTFAIPKMLALFLLMFLLLVAGALTGIMLQALQGYTRFQLGAYLSWYIAPTGVGIGLVAVLSVFVQVLSPHKFIGWGIMGVFLIGSIVLVGAGLDHNLYLYGSTPRVPLSDMNGQGHFAIAAWWFTAYWAALAVVLATLSHLLWRRGVDPALGPRLAALPRALRGPAGTVAVAGLVTFVGLGAFIFHNTNRLNVYRTADDSDARAARVEKELLRFENAPRPVITDVRYAIDIRPAELRATTDGAWRIENRTGSPLAELHLFNPNPFRTRLEKVTVEGARLAREWPDLGYRIYRFDEPMRPGEARSVSFRTVIEQRGFANGPRLLGVYGNGTFLDNRAFAPLIGISRFGLLNDRAKRRKYGLPAELRPLLIDDPAGRSRNYIGADWVRSDITISTDGGQTPIAPGVRVADRIANGRRTSRFVTEAPILHFLSVQSARYVERARMHNGVSLRVFYDAQHPYNVDRMLNALVAGLDTYQAAFGPYQFREARIIEFPTYQQFAQAFAGTMPYSEGVGFIAKLEPERIDYVTDITAHELAHQWWAHQVVSADVEGATVLVETLAQYSSMLVREHMYGPDRIRRFLKYELDAYLRGRARDQDGERPLMLNRNQDYIHYQKGSLVMYLLKDRMGEDAVNRALRSLITRYRFKGAPYPTARDLVAALRAEAGPENHQLITDLFERITLYDAKVTDATTTRRADGRYNVAVTVSARKLYSDNKGRETEAPLNEMFDIGLFTDEPGKDAFDHRDVLLLQTVPLRTGTQVFRFVTAKSPTFAGIDPYNKRIDRNSDDNLKRLGG